MLIFLSVNLHPLLVMADKLDSERDFGDVGHNTLLNYRTGSFEDCSVEGLQLHKIDPPQGCKFLNDNDPTLQYSYGWILNSSNSNLPRYTVHSAQNAGPSVSTTFNR